VLLFSNYIFKDKSVAKEASTLFPGMSRLDKLVQLLEKGEHVNAAFKLAHC
jgi:hypothetical protein